MVSDELRAFAHKLRIETRAAQGLPPTVEDPAVLGQLAELFRDAATPKAAAS